MNHAQGSQNSLQKKFTQQKMNSQGHSQTLPMTPDEVLKHYGKHLSPYEREEIFEFDMIYYLPLNSKNKGVGQYIKNELTCQDENPKEGTGPPYNHGFDNDQADYIYEAKD